MLRLGAEVGGLVGARGRRLNLVLLYHGLEYGGRVGIDCGGWFARLVGSTGRLLD